MAFNGLSLYVFRASQGKKEKKNYKFFKYFKWLGRAREALLPQAAGGGGNMRMVLFHTCVFFVSRTAPLDSRAMTALSPV